MWSSLGDCPSEGRAEEGPCLESGSMPGRWHARGRTELAYLQGVATCTIQFDTRCPLARPSGGSPPTLAGALPPEFIYGACPSSLSLAVSQLSACMCLSRESCFVLYCLHSCPPYVCVSINMKNCAGTRKRAASSSPTRPLRGSVSCGSGRGGALSRVSFSHSPCRACSRWASRSSRTSASCA